MKKLIILYICSLFIIGCSEENAGNVASFKTGSGIFYDIILLGDGEKSIAEGGWVQLNLKLSWKDSVMFNSIGQRERGKFFLNIDQELHPGGLKELLMNLKEGDSVRALIPQDNFFKDFPYIKKPDYILANQLIAADLRVFKFMTDDEYNEFLDVKNGRNNRKEHRTAIKEYSELSNYLNENNIDPTKNFIGGIYLLKTKETSGAVIESNDVVTMKYQCYLLNGEMIDSYEEDPGFTMVMGKPDQVIKGIEVALHKMKEGEHARLIIPSDLAFGPDGSIGDIVQPYTSLVYNVQIEKVNKNE